MPKPPSRNGAGGVFYCVVCSSGRVTAVSASPWRMECLVCGSPEIGIRDNLSITQAARWLGVEYHWLSAKLTQHGARPVIIGRRKLFKLSEIKRVWDLLQTKPQSPKSRRLDHALSA